MEQEKLGIENLKTVAANSITVASELIDASKDGIQLGDTFVVYRNLSKMSEVASKAKAALAELKDLSSDEAEELLENVANALPGTTVTMEKIRQSIRLTARAYRVVAEAVDIVQDAIELYK